MKIELKDLKKGDKVWCGCHSGFCRSGIVTVGNVAIKNIDGLQSKVITIDGQDFLMSSGLAINGAMAYRLEPCDQSLKAEG